MVLFEYKNYALKYAPNTLAPEVIDTIILFFYEIIRLYIELKPTEESVKFILITLPAIFCILFFMFLTDLCVRFS